MIELQKSQEWLDEYRATIGGSKAPVVANTSPWETAEDYWECWTGRKPWPDVTGPDVLRGQLLEPIAIRLLEAELDESITPHNQDEFVYNDRYPFAHVLPDAWVGPQVQPWEIKIPRTHGYRRILREGVPRDYVIQCWHAMAVLDKYTSHGLAIMNPETMELTTYQIQRDAEGESNLMEAEATFADCVKHDIRPEPADVPVLNLPEISKGETILALDSPDMQEATQYYLEMRDILDDARKGLDEAKAALRERAQGLAVYEVPGLLRVYDRELPGHKSFDKPKLAAFLAEQERAVEEFQKTGKPYRRFDAYDLRRKGE